MKRIHLIAIAVLVTCLQACSTLPPSAALDTADVQKVTWTKGRDAEAFRDQYGVCHTFSRDTQAALKTLGEQVKACFEGALPAMTVSDPARNSVKVAWKKMPRDLVTAAYADAMAPSVIDTKGRRRNPVTLFAVRGFYVYQAGTCHVVVSDHQDYVGTLGHEFKHCVDGLFHDENGGWKHDHAA